MNNPYVSFRLPIIDIVKETDIDYTYRFESDIKPENGQFLEVSLPGIGEAPISISDFGDGFIDLTIRKVGKLTGEVFDLAIGDYLYARGPYGNGFLLENYIGKNLIIVAGGTGLAPVRSIINYFYDNMHELKSFKLIVGFKSPKDILFKDDIERWKGKIDVTLTVDKGDENWKGNTGLVTEYIKKLEILDKEKTEAIVVGPPMMMKFSNIELMNREVPEDKVWVSFERKMSCGIGKCGHCKIDDTYVCLEGPVFNYTKAKNLID
ncbi:anaerobic sulfite reductase subunit AsrB [Anaeromicrobium sediminis]|uniref:Anaerobic sulfite reductase subunit B n=1 Tax=Anaeromicrobium sediminis TaxID=1478221 RepID=A0A267MLR1_9FIRM|nr:anaerobic sulfite reductase subunit AsrB [Anaeromicrobium sediminis]PAB59848.1 anaerobic sulfite reductase subunit B [Anaeromicrobium sediminis]